jgi:hypothetical protein
MVMEAEYNKCLFCGKWIHKPKLFCDDVCERAYRVKELLSELHGVAIGNANKQRIAMVLNIARMLRNGRTEREIFNSLVLWFTPRTVRRYIELARKVNELEA